MTPVLGGALDNRGCERPIRCDEAFNKGLRCFHAHTLVHVLALANQPTGHQGLAKSRLMSLAQFSPCFALCEILIIVTNCLLGRS